MSSCVIAYVPLQVTFAASGQSPVKKKTPRVENGKEGYRGYRPQMLRPRYRENDAGPEEVSEAATQYGEQKKFGKWFILKWYREPPQPSCNVGVLSSRVTAPMRVCAPRCDRCI